MTQKYSHPPPPPPPPPPKPRSSFDDTEHEETPMANNMMRKHSVRRTPSSSQVTAAVEQAAMNIDDANTTTRISNVTDHQHNTIPSFDPPSRSNSKQISVGTIVSSQFEDEATTHILAALETEEHTTSSSMLMIDSLLGEGIDEEDGTLDNYSEDEEDDEHVRRPDPYHSRSDTVNTHGNTSFLRNVMAQNNLAQYQINYSDEEEEHDNSTDGSPSKESQLTYTKMRAEQQVSNDSHNDAANLASRIQEGQTNHKRIRTHIAADLMHEGLGGNEDCIADLAAALVATQEESDGDPIERGAANNPSHHSRRDGEESTVRSQKQPQRDANTLTDATEATDTLRNFGNMLHSLQRGGRSMSRLSISSRRLSSAGGNGGGDPDSDKDKLISALAAVDSTKNMSFFTKFKREFVELVKPKLPKFFHNINQVLMLLVLPNLAVAALLFYIFDNPLAGKTETSWSWWVLFLGVRQPMIFEITRIGQVFWVEILALRSQSFNAIFGPYVSLAFIQSQGWPYILCFWAILDFVMLYGDYPFPRHWLFWQKRVDMFNENNPTVGITDSEIYMRILIACIVVGVSVSLKRLLLSIFLGRRTIKHFGAELESLMSKMILIGEVANLARDIETKKSIFEDYQSPTNDDDDKMVRFRQFMNDESDSIETTPTPSPQIKDHKRLDVPNLGSSDPATPGNEESRDSNPKSMRDGSRSPTRPTKSPTPEVDPHGSSTANVKLMFLLSEWEEPEIVGKQAKKASVRDLVHFRKAVSYMYDNYPFSRAFGEVKTREMCVDSSQRVYDRLMLSAGDASALPFSILSILAMDDDGDYVEAKIKALIRLYRPDRLGNLTKLDFVKSIDTVYKQLRLLRASIANSGQIDNAFEKLVNVFFYFFLVIIAVAIAGVDIWSVFLSFNTFFLGFSFLFGSAASNYFEGLLLIFLRRPYDIGDRIATSNPRDQTNENGSSTWFVDQVTLFTTTVRFATTNEVATYSNGSLAQLRIINANRSPKAIVSVLIKFGLETPFGKVTVFRTAIENFVKARPRQWIALLAFRATRIEVDLGYIEYKIVVQHRESWQNVGPILQSKADLSSFVLECSKKLNMRYESPPMPVNIASASNLGGVFAEEYSGNFSSLQKAADQNISADDLQDVAAMFAVKKE